MYLPRCLDPIRHDSNPIQRIYRTWVCPQGALCHRYSLLVRLRLFVAQGAVRGERGNRRLEDPCGYIYTLEAAHFSSYSTSQSEAYLYNLPYIGPRSGAVNNGLAGRIRQLSMYTYESRSKVIDTRSNPMYLTKSLIFYGKTILTNTALLRGTHTQATSHQLGDYCDSPDTML